jgi:hypothetical protein
MDEVLVGNNPPESPFPDILTTWHARDTLIEALHFFLFDTTPYEEARASCRSGLITAANPVWVNEIKEYISTHVTIYPLT